MNSPSFEFIQSSKIKIHNKPISKKPLFFSHSSNPQITISNKTLHYNNNKVSKISKAQNPNQQKVPKFESNYYITSFPKPIYTNHHHHPDTQHTTITSRITKLTDSSIIGAWKRVKKIQRVVNKRDLPEADLKSFQDSRETNTPPPLPP